MANNNPSGATPPDTNAFKPDDMVRVEGGRFDMGHGPHGIEVPDFYIGKYPVTFLEYERYCKKKGVPVPSDNGWGKGKRPIINITWQQATEYCNWLSEVHGLQPAYLSIGKDTVELDRTSNGFRLPSEAEWEYAAIGGKKQVRKYKYAGSNTLSDVTDVHAQKTQEVGQKKANDLGLYDMSGNVCEWCEDIWHPNKQMSNAPRDGSAWTDYGNTRFRVVRGGCWSIAESNRECIDRESHDAIKADRRYGFRVARSLGEAEPVSPLPPKQETQKPTAPTGNAWPVTGIEHPINPPQPKQKPQRSEVPENRFPPPREKENPTPHFNYLIGNEGTQSAIEYLMTVLEDGKIKDEVLIQQGRFIRFEKASKRGEIDSKEFLDVCSQIDTLLIDLVRRL